MIINDCIVCENKKYEVWNNKLDGVVAVECDSCGFIWINPRPSDEEISNYYATNTIKRKTTDNAKREEQYKLDAKYIKQFLTDTKLRVLDFGCHDGSFLQHFDNKCFDRFGVDIDECAIDIAKEKDSNGQYSCDVNDFSGQFDLVIMRGVIEHLTYPNECMRKISDLVFDGGFLYLAATPNAGSYSARHLRERWNQFDPPAHLLYFNDYTLEKYLKKFGFILVDKNFPYAETPYSDIEKDKEKIKLAINNDDGTKILTPFFGNMMSAVFERRK